MTITKWSIGAKPTRSRSERSKMTKSNRKRKKLKLRRENKKS